VILSVCDFNYIRSKVKVTWSKNTKRRSSGWRELCTVLSAQPLVLNASIEAVGIFSVRCAATLYMCMYVLYCK